MAGRPPFHAASPPLRLDDRGEDLPHGALGRAVAHGGHRQGPHDQASPEGPTPTPRR